MNSKVRTWTLVVVLNLFIAGAGVVAYTEFRDDGGDDEEEKDNLEEDEDEDKDEDDENGEQSSNQPPGPITHFVGVSGDGLIQLEWNAVETATGYQVYMLDTSTLQFTDESYDDLTDCTDNSDCAAMMERSGWVTHSVYEDLDFANSTHWDYFIQEVFDQLTNVNLFLVYVTAINDEGAGPASNVLSFTPMPEEMAIGCEWPNKISTPYTGGDGGGLKEIKLYDLSWNIVASVDLDSTSGIYPASGIKFDEELTEGETYIAICFWKGWGGAEGPVLATITNPYNGYQVVKVNLASEIMMNLIVAAEGNPNTFLDSDLSRPLSALMSDANTITERILDYHSSTDFSYRQFDSQADRDADAIHSIVVEALSRSKPVYTTDITPVNVQAHGGGLDGIRSVTAMLNNPVPPLIEMMMFDRSTSTGQTDIVWSDPMLKRWDVSQVGAVSPTVVTGGSMIVFVSTPDILLGGEQQDGWIQTAWSRNFGQTEFTRVIPDSHYVVSATLSPDESMLAFAGSETDYWEMAYCNLFVYRFADQSIQKLTNYQDDDGFRLGACDGVKNIAWTPDGGSILFDMYDDPDSSGENATAHLEIVDSDGSSSPRILMQEEGWTFTAPQVAPTNDSFILSCAISGLIFEICTAPMGLDANQTFQGTTYYGDLASAHVGHKFLPTFSADASRIIFTHQSLDDQGELQQSFVIIDRFSAEVLEETAAYAGSETLGQATYAATEFTLIPRYSDGYEYNEYGQVVVSSGSDDRYYGGSGYGTNSYYHEIIPAANSMTDPWGNSAYSFSVTSW